MPAPRPEDLVRLYPKRDFLIAEGKAGAPYMLAMHRAFYRYASHELGEARRVLDAGCGTGIGTELLAGATRLAIGIDVKPPVLRYAATHHREGGPRYAGMDATVLAFADATFDAIVADELLEHLPHPGAFLDEAVRVLRPDGVFLCATVNALETFGSRDRPANRNHFHEYDAPAFRSELCRCFDEVTLLGQAAGDSYRRHAGGLGARLVERGLMALGLKHWIPPELRSRVRSWLTGSDPASLEDEEEFPVREGDLAEAVYLVAVARKPRKEPSGGRAASSPT
ncbi:MAG: class I SAM-dependent methyltransferase [Gemmatimonadota bacterium]|nr:class I SAM-dependent methyltransferase [Gemmatimonadota bacterium]